MEKQENTMKSIVVILYVFTVEHELIRYAITPESNKIHIYPRYTTFARNFINSI